MPDGCGAPDNTAGNQERGPNAVALDCEKAIADLIAASVAHTHNLIAFSPTLHISESFVAPTGAGTEAIRIG